MPTHITLIRHGETDWNSNGKFQGHACVPLNEEGHHQAAVLAEHLVATVQDVTAIYASDSLRTHQTADPVAAQLGLTISFDTRLREIDLGEWQGLTLEEVERWDAERHHFIMADPFNLPRPGGESGIQVAQRALSVLEEIAAAHSGEHVLVITHGGTIRNLLHLLGLALDNHDHILNTSLTRLVHNPDHADTYWLLDSFNMTGHLIPIKETPDSIETSPEQDG